MFKDTTKLRELCNASCDPQTVCFSTTERGK